jgi:hypothetical protein
MIDKLLKKRLLHLLNLTKCITMRHQLRITSILMNASKML